MGPTLLRYAAHARAIEFDGIKVFLAHVAGVRGEVDGLLLHRIYAVDFEIAFGDLAFQGSRMRERLLGVEVVKIDVRVAVTPTAPKELVAGIENIEIVVDRNPVGTLF